MLFNQIKHFKHCAVFIIGWLQIVFGRESMNSTQWALLVISAAESLAPSDSDIRSEKLKSELG